MPPPDENTQEFNMELDMDYILFANYLLKMNGNNPQATFVNYTIKKGKLKPQHKINAASGFLVLEQMDANDQPLNQNFEHNPLIKTLEYVDENGQLNKKEVVLDSVEYSLRTQINPKTKKFILSFQKNGHEKLKLHILDI